MSIDEPFNFPQRRPIDTTTKSISIIIPLYNEEESLSPLFELINKELTLLFENNWEVIFVDDGSDDNSLSEIQKLVQKNTNVKYISFRRNCGKSAALAAGFAECNGDYVVTMDADLQDDPSEIRTLISKLNEGYDLVSG